MIVPRKKYRDKFILTKSDPLFTQRLENISRERWSKRIDKTPRPLGIRIFQRKILRHKNWSDIEKDLKIAEFLKEEDAFMTSFNWFNIIIVSFLAVLVFAGMIYTMGLLNGVFHQVGIDNDKRFVPNTTWVNMTQAADTTFGQVNSSIQALRLVALTLIFSLIVGTILVNLLIKISPAYFFIYVLIVILAVIFSAPVSNAYYNLLSSDVFGGILPSFTGANWFILNLPLVVAMGGLLGGVFLFINIIRGAGEGEIR